MIKINEQLLLDDLGYTATAINAGVNKNFIKNNYDRFISLNNALFYNFDKIYILDTFYDEKIDNILAKSKDQSLKRFIKFLNDNQEYMWHISKNYCDFIEKINFYPCDFWDIIRRYSEKDFIDLILGYYSTYGNDIYKIVKKYFDEERIQIGTIVDESTLNLGGYYEWLQWLNSGYILGISDAYNSFTASMITHELGHAIDTERFIFPQQKNISLFSDWLSEVPSKTFEIGFHDYLKDSYIDVDGARILKNYEADFCYGFLNNLGAVLSKKEISIDYDGCAIDNDTKEEYDLRKYILYGLGDYYAMHLNLIRQSSNKEFLKAFNDLITMRNEMSFKDTFERIGFTEEEFISGKLIYPKVENDFIELKKRFKY